MALAMASPTSHQKSGTYVLRLRVPADLRATCKRLYGVSAELRENLGTKDCREAKAAFPAALGRLQAKLDHARNLVTGILPAETEPDIMALAGDFYRDQWVAHGDNPGDPDDWDAMNDNLGNRVEQIAAAPRAAWRVSLTPADLEAAAQYLARRSLPCDPDTVQRHGSPRRLQRPPVSRERATPKT